MTPGSTAWWAAKIRQTKRHLAPVPARARAGVGGSGGPSRSTTRASPASPADQEPLERTEEAVWRSATALAMELEAVPAFASGLRRLASGAELADRLGLAVEDSVATFLRAGTPPNMALGLDWLATRRGARAKLRFAMSKLFPSPVFMRAWSSIANRGRLGLVASYVQRWAWIALHAGTAVRAWLAAHRQGRRMRSAE